VHAPGRVRLAALTAGSGPRGVLLIPELGRSGKCGWWDFAAYLAANGYRVLAFDHRCTGESSCPSGPAAGSLMPDIRAAASWLRRAGAARVVLTGASQGASEALIAATRPPPGVTAVVSLSADELTTALAARPYPVTATAAAPRLARPALFAVAAADPYVGVPATRRLFAAARSGRSRLVVLGPGAGHGWDLVRPDQPGAARPPLAATILAFLRAMT
jgi:pimeloyl-ACP methyl ester carboxylesterase